ncbi:unnamed protein product [Malus baccata var. baccata]
MKGISRLFPHTGYCVKPAMQEQDLISCAQKSAINLHRYDSTYVKVHSISMWVCVTGCACCCCWIHGFCVTYHVSVRKPAHRVPRRRPQSSLFYLQLSSHLRNP